MICAAVDIGASNGRVIVAKLADGKIALEEIHRFNTPLIPAAGDAPLQWDIEEIVKEVSEGVAKADAHAPIESVGVDSWGVDYVLIDEKGKRVAPAVAYRDHRTADVAQAVRDEISPFEVFRRTGIQFLIFNTIYQFAASVRQHPEWLISATGR